MTDAAELAAFHRGELRGIIINDAFGSFGLYLSKPMQDFMESSCSWKKPTQEWQLRTDQDLARAVVEFPDQFAIKRVFNVGGNKSHHMTREWTVVFVQPEVIQARAWWINVYDGAESLAILPERIALWKIRQSTTDPVIQKLATLEENEYWYYGHIPD